MSEQITLLPPGPTSRTAQEMMRMAMASRTDYRLRRLAENITARLAPKDQVSEVLAIYHWVLRNKRYLNDPHGVELVRDPEAMLSAQQGDCFPEGTLLLRNDFSLVPIEHTRIGDRIWGYDRWSTVEAVVRRGERTMWAARLNNGSNALLSKDHKFFAGRCEHKRRESGVACLYRCKVDDVEVKRVAFPELCPGDFILQPKRLPFGTGCQDPEEAWVEGVFIADGWICNTKAYEFSISGQDGKPKEMQKKRVEDFCRSRGIATRWQRKSIAVRDSQWTDRLRGCGHLARNKRAITLDLDEGAALNLLRGIMADSGANTNGPGRTFTTTSRLLAVQTRILHLMAGIHCGSAFIEDHGGLGEHPIWRLFVRTKPKQLLVKEIFNTKTTAQCWDITTDDHYVYLPEHDVTVSNCDDAGVLIGALCMAVGRQVRFVTVGFRPNGPHSHTFVEVLVGKNWITLDPVANARTPKMLGQVRQASFFY